MRDRLIELLRTVDNMRLMRKGFSECANYLLANGVIVPPCKVEDTVYCINTFSVKDPRINICEVDSLHITSGKNHRGHRKPSYALVRDKNMRNLSTRVYFENFGKTVFLTKEEAEQALKGGEG